MIETLSYPERFLSSIPLSKGDSSDRKFLLEGKDGNAYLIRLSPLSQKEKKRQEFNLLCYLRAEGITQVPFPYEFSDTKDGCYTYQILSYAKGEAISPALSPKEQHFWGMESGKVLKKIHALPAPKGWNAEQNGTLPALRIWLTKENASLPQETKEGLVLCLQREEGRLQALSAKEQASLLHGAYTLEHLLIGEKLSVLSFSRLHFGPSLEEFFMLPSLASTHPAFAAGLLKGYFKSIPELFFQTSCFYAAVACLQANQIRERGTNPIGKDKKTAEREETTQGKNNKETAQNLSFVNRLLQEAMEKETPLWAKNLLKFM